MGFYPDRGGGQLVTSGAASQSITVRASAKAVRICNYGNLAAYVRIGTAASGVPAANTDLMVDHDSSIILRKGDGEDTVAYIQDSGPTTLSIHSGEEY